MKTLFSIAFTSFFGVASLLADPFLENSANFNFKYEADVVPGHFTPAFMVSGDGSYSVSGDVLQVGSTTEQRQFFSLPNGMISDSETGAFVVEWRMRVTDGSIDPAGGTNMSAEFRFREAEQLWLAIYPDSLVVNGSATLNPASAQLSVALDASEWNVFRLARLPNEPTFMLWVNDELVADNLVATASGTDIFMFGDLASNRTFGSFELDYLRWHNPSSGAWELLGVERISDKAPHSAFTDLIFFEGHFYCAFREASTHVSNDGRLRVIRSADGVDWETVALMIGENEGDDVRDAKLSITATGKLMLNGAIVMNENPDVSRWSVTWLSPDGTHWSQPYFCPSGIDTWRWSVSWHEGFAYSVAYSGKDVGGHLYKSEDGKTWSSVAEAIFPVTEGVAANEVDLTFLADDTAVAFTRRNPKRGPDGRPELATALLGFASPPYTDWEWRDAGKGIGGPIMRELSDGRFVAVVRLFRPTRTSLLVVDLDNATMDEVLPLPSRGDSSYAGIVEKDGILWISYYSSHEERTSIYLARVKIPE